MWTSASKSSAERFRREAAVSKVPRKREPRPPVLRARIDQAPAEVGKPVGRAELRVRGGQPFEREIGPLGRDVNQLFPERDRLGRAPFLVAHVSEAQVGRQRARIHLDRGFEPLRRLLAVAPREGFTSELVLDEGERRLTARLVLGRGRFAQPLADGVSLLPLFLLGVQLLEVEERVLVLRIEPQDFGERLDRAVDEAAAAVVEAEAEQHVCVLQLPQVGPLQERLMLLNRASDLTLLAIQVAEDEAQLERLGVQRAGARQRVYRLIGLVGDEEVQAEDEMGRVAEPPPVDPAAVLQLVALPCLAGREADEQRDRAPAMRSCALLSIRHQNICVRHKSWTWTTPSITSPSPTTTTAVIFRSSMTLNASTARSDRRIVTGRGVITSAAVASRMAASQWRRRSPSVMMPARRPAASATHVMPSRLLDISCTTSFIGVSTRTRGISVPTVHDVLDTHQAPPEPASRVQAREVLLAEALPH